MHTGSKPQSCVKAGSLLNYIAGLDESAQTCTLTQRLIETHFARYLKVCVLTSAGGKVKTAQAALKKPTYIDEPCIVSTSPRNAIALLHFLTAACHTDCRRSHRRWKKAISENHGGQIRSICHASTTANLRLQSWSISSETRTLGTCIQAPITAKRSRWSISILSLPKRSMWEVGSWQHKHASAFCGPTSLGSCTFDSFSCIELQLLPAPLRPRPSIHLAGCFANGTVAVRMVAPSIRRHGRMY